jgi:ABC-type multidrug transport system ATPase subunit
LEVKFYAIFSQGKGRKRIIIITIQDQLLVHLLCLQAYVTQSDDLIATLTVKEYLHYAADLRLPSSHALITRAEKREIVNNTIQQMGLQECANTHVGNWHLRGLSGGEKRRLSIALEILTRPRLLFLDEPTTGLDRYYLLQAR